MHNQDIVTLTPLGQRVVDGLAEKPNRPSVGDDIIFYLNTAPKYKATCEELGMNLKVLAPELKEALNKLEKGGYIYVNHLQEYHSMGPGHSEFEHHGEGEMVYEHEAEEEEECDDDGKC